MTRDDITDFDIFKSANGKWALEACGASYTLQEILTAKSDDLGVEVGSFAEHEIKAPLDDDIPDFDDF